MSGKVGQSGNVWKMQENVGRNWESQKKKQHKKTKTLMKNTAKLKETIYMFEEFGKMINLYLYLFTQYLFIFM